MAGDLFHSLMLNAVDEIVRRDPQYLSKQPVKTGRAAFAGSQALAERLRGIPAAGRHSVG